jgi:hypothetical protein
LFIHYSNEVLKGHNNISNRLGDCSVHVMTPQEYFLQFCFLVKLFKSFFELFKKSISDFLVSDTTQDILVVSEIIIGNFA